MVQTEFDFGGLGLLADRYSKIREFYNKKKLETNTAMR